jgi:hypothetical protein
MSCDRIEILGLREPIICIINIIIYICCLEVSFLLNKAISSVLVNFPCYLLHKYICIFLPLELPRQVFVIFYGDEPRYPP